MGVLDWAKALIERKSYRLSDPAALAVFAGGSFVSGGAVSPETALKVPAVFAAVKVHAESIAQLPLKLYRHLPDGGKEEARDHPLFDLLNAAPNPFTTSVEWRLAMQSALSAYGNAFSFINRDGSGRVVELIYLHPNQVAVEIDTATTEPMYRVTDLAGNQNIYSRSEVFHLRTFGTGTLAGYVGQSPIVQAREAIGLALQLEAHAAILFSNGARPGGIFEYPKVLGKDGRQGIRASLTENYAGSLNSGKTMILEDGMKFTPLQFNSVDSQFIELRQFAIQEIARVFRVPAHLIGDLNRSTNNNIEQQGRDFVQLCLLPIARTWEDAIALSLLTAEERKTHFAAFQFDDFMRADIDKRYGAYCQAITNGLLNPNEARALENLPSYPGGEVYTRQLNTSPVADAAAPPLSKLDSQTAGVSNNA